MFSPDPARKPLTRAISPGWSGQASSSREVGASPMPPMIADRLPPMRIAAVPDGPVERLGLLLNKLPTPIGEAMFAMPIARCLQVAQRTGMLAALAEGPREPGSWPSTSGCRGPGRSASST